MRWIAIAIVSLICVGAASAPKPAPAPASKPAPVRVSIKSMQYQPATIGIKAGQTVLWTNNDDRDHTVVASDGAFKSANIPAGASYSFTFAKKGKFIYGCKYHPRMKGVIVVSE
jgi:plastocyanin